MGMNNKIICSICGAALCAHLAHERHQDADYITRSLAKRPALDTLVYIRLPHGEDPEAPSGPVRSASTVEVGSASTTVQIAGVSAMAFAGKLTVDAGPTDVTGGSVRSAQP